MSHAHELAPRSEDLIDQEALKASVRERYRGIVGDATSIAEVLYAPEELQRLPVAAVEAALGVGHPTRWAGLRRGEIVVDLGSGGGIDTILAAQLVAPDGRAIGVDTLPEMLERAAANAAAIDVTNIEWRRGELEQIPLDDATVDVVISNGVLNLSPRKGRAIAEMFRVLRPAGRISIADIVLDEDLPPEIMIDPDAWAG
ncbi:MAG TPA: methyltransferase domain-containing protein [Candidatus Limnocylindria bacterium]|jgi:SAM-dependent methyltransferase